MQHGPSRTRIDALKLIPRRHDDTGEIQHLNYRPRWPNSPAHPSPFASDKGVERPKSRLHVLSYATQDTVVAMKRRHRLVIR